MTETFARLPAYLKKYCVEQDYDSYTSRDHAAWRFIMRQNRDFFRSHAVSIYETGLAKTGIPIDRIPRVSEMDEKLQQFGWGAVAVSGFIPPSAFLEFQALGVLAIACDMRTAEHIEYTPAPDIVHEAAGHAPIIADPEYAAYLKRYARMAQRAIFSREDINVYEAVRYLSDIKENPDTTAAELESAELKFQTAVAAVGHVSEATKVGRMAWWTVEYGLVGKTDPRIYGAGLLSSVGESQNCLATSVKKIPLTVDCVNQAFDITKPQPQLFVANDLGQLTQVLEDLEKTMSFVRGGAFGLEQAKLSGMVNTCILDSGIEIAGELVRYDLNDRDLPDFLRFRGPVQLAYRGNEILGHGRTRHSQGYSSPLGRLAEFPNQLPQDLSDADLKKIGCERGRACTLKFQSGFVVSGVVGGWTRRDGKLLLMNFRRATVSRGSEIFFEPSWGEFDLAIGETVVSVHGGPANREEFGEYDVGIASTKPGRASPYSDEEFELFAIYSALRKIRDDQNFQTNRAQHLAALEAIAKPLLKSHGKEWLARLEVLEIGKQKFLFGDQAPDWYRELEANALKHASDQGSIQGRLVRMGLKLADQA